MKQLVNVSFEKEKKKNKKKEKTVCDLSFKFAHHESHKRFSAHVIAARCWKWFNDKTNKKK